MELKKQRLQNREAILGLLKKICTELFKVHVVENRHGICKDAWVRYPLT